MREMRATSAMCLTLALATSAFAQELVPDKKHAMSSGADYSPFVDQHYPTRVFFGDTHPRGKWRLIDSDSF